MKLTNCVMYKFKGIKLVGVAYHAINNTNILNFYLLISIWTWTHNKMQHSKHKKFQTIYYYVEYLLKYVKQWLEKVQKPGFRYY